MYVHSFYFKKIKILGKNFMKMFDTYENKIKFINHIKKLQV